MSRETLHTKPTGRYRHRMHYRFFRPSLHVLQIEVQCTTSRTIWGETVFENLLLWRDANQWDLVHNVLQSPA